MKRVIVDFSKLNQEILDLLVEKYPDGYMSKDIIAFRNSQNKMIEAVEVSCLLYTSDAADEVSPV